MKYKYRFEPLIPYMEGKTLDVCCVGMGTNDIIGGCDFLHGHLKRIKNITSLKGIDINKEGVDLLNNNGFDVIHQDVQEPFELNEKFKTIICEEGIEHLDDLKQFLTNVRNHLEPNGKFSLTTPNMEALEIPLSVILFGGVRKNLFHTHYHIDKSIKYLLEHNGFEVLEMGFHNPYNEGLNGFGLAFDILMKIIPIKRFKKTIWVVAKCQNQ